MCYLLLLSTSSQDDLTQYNSELLKFSSKLPALPDIGKLKYKHQWYIGSKSGCSCTFRHLYSVELGFGEPEDWNPEEPDEVAATLQLIKVIRDLISHGEQIDCIDSWEHQGGQSACPVERVVDLSQTSDMQFRLFENHHFIFCDFV